MAMDPAFLVIEQDHFVQQDLVQIIQEICPGAVVHVFDSQHRAAAALERLAPPGVALVHMAPDSFRLSGLFDALRRAGTEIVLLNEDPGAAETTPGTAQAAVAATGTATGTAKGPAAGPDDTGPTLPWRSVAVPYSAAAVLNALHDCVVAGKPQVSG